MDSFTSPWPTRDCDDMPTDTLQMDMITDLQEQFEPQQRARSNTWPLPRPDNFVEPTDEADSAKCSNQQLATCECDKWVAVFVCLTCNGFVITFKACVVLT